MRTHPNSNSLANVGSFIGLIFLRADHYLAQFGCDCESVPEIRETSLVCFVGTSTRESTYLPSPERRAQIKVRELGLQDGSSPSTSVVASPPSAGTTQI